MTDLDEEEEGFGAPPNVIPFPGMRQNPRLTELWRAEVTKANTANRTTHVFASPLDFVDQIITDRSLPVMSWPASWVGIARRARTYPGDCISVAGAKGGGKTSFAIQVAIANTGDGTPVIWCALELDPKQISTRIVGNMHGVHTAEIRERWPSDRIAHSLTAIADMWRFVDRYSDTERQVGALMDAIHLAKKVYRRPPLVIIDYLGKLASMAKDIKLATIQAVEQMRAAAIAEQCFIMLLVQTSRANEGILTGRIDIEAATDAMGIAAESAEVEAACRVQIALSLFKADDMQELDGHALVSKSNVGEEGREGVRFHKPGGVWHELGFLPATPNQVKAEVEKARKDKHRTTPPPSPPQARADINAARAGDADASRRVSILDALVRHGALGMELRFIRQIRGAGRGTAVMHSLRELEAAGSAERISGNKWRAITRML